MLCVRLLRPIMPCILLGAVSSSLVWFFWSFMSGLSCGRPFAFPLRPHLLYPSTFSQLKLPFKLQFFLILLFFL